MLCTNQLARHENASAFNIKFHKKTQFIQLCQNNKTFDHDIVSVNQFPAQVEWLYCIAKEINRQL